MPQSFLYEACILRAFIAIMGFSLFRVPRGYSPRRRSFACLQILSILIVLTIGVILSHRADGYVLEGVSWPSGSVVTFKMGLGSAGRTLIDGNTSWDTAASPGLTSWNNVVARLDYASDIASTFASSGDRVNSVVFSTTIFGQKFGTGTLAVTYYRSMGSTFTEADILFNKNQQFDSYRGPLRYNSGGWAIGDIRRVFIHELGHALGLDHPDQHGQHVDAIMNSVTSDRETLSSDDIAGAQKLYGAPAVGSLNATPAPLYDFNHDGKPDYLLYNASTRQTAIWYLSGSSFVGGAYGPSLPSGWQLVAVGDFNADSNPDYVLYNASTHQTAIWYLSGFSFVGGAYGPSLPSGWQLVAVGDFNADSKPDYVLYNASTRQTAIWYLSGASFKGGAYAPTLPAGLEIVGLADFNGDGKPDYLLYNASTGQTAIWYLSGTSISSDAFGPTIPSGYTLIGAADFSGDGKPDYVLLNTSTRQTLLWYLNDNLAIGSANGPTLPAGWSLVQP
jgi:Matrixin/FG-GAP-like repeat